MPTRFPNGVSSYGIPVLGGLDVPANANVFFVDSGHASGSDGNPGTDPNAPLLTLDAAIGLCTANNGDHIFVMPGHAETSISSAITLDVAGVTVWGWGYGRSKPAFTVSAAAVDLITVTAANCHLHNLRLLGASSLATALINIAAADLVMTQIDFEPAETPLATITVASGGHRFHLKDFRVRSSANGPDFFMDFETSASDNWIVEDGFINFLTNGLDNAVFRANVDTTSGGIIRNVIAIGLDAAALFFDVNSSSAVGEGLIVDCAWQHLAAATIAAGLDLGGYGTARISASDGPSRGAILLPATSSS